MSGGITVGFLEKSLLSRGGLGLVQGPTEVLLDCTLQVGIIIASGLSQAREVPGKCMD